MNGSVVSAPPLDRGRLGAWLQAEVPAFHGLRDAERLIGGNSNPIWQLRADSARTEIVPRPAEAGVCGWRFASRISGSRGRAFWIGTC